jgi:hypothetical protein
MASFVPSGERARAVAGDGAVLRVRKRVPLVDQSLTVKSSLADATTFPSREQATAETREAWPPLDQSRLRATAGWDRKKQRVRATTKRCLRRRRGVLANPTARRDELRESLYGQRFAAEVRASCNSALPIMGI